MITMTRGDDRTLQVSVYTDEKMTAVQNLTGIEAARFTARNGSPDGAIVFTKDLNDGITVTNAAAGSIAIAIDPEDTYLLTAQSTMLIYDIEITFPGTVVITVETGEILVKADISQYVAP